MNDRKARIDAVQAPGCPVSFHFDCYVSVLLLPTLVSPLYSDYSGIIASLSHCGCILIFRLLQDWILSNAHPFSLGNALVILLAWPWPQFCLLVPSCRHLCAMLPECYAMHHKFINAVVWLGRWREEGTPAIFLRTNFGIVVAL